MRKRSALVLHLALLLGISAWLFSTRSPEPVTFYAPWCLSDCVDALRLYPTGVVPLPGSPFPTGPYPVAALAHPTGFLYVANTGSSVSAYGIESERLEELPGSPFETGGPCRSMGFDPQGRFLYVATGDPKSIVGFSIQESGALRPLAGSPFPLEAEPGPGNYQALVADLDRPFLIAGASDSRASSYGIFVYDRNPDDGSLARTPRSTAREKPRWLTFNPRSNLVYGGDGDDPGIFAYSLGPDGRLVPRPDAEVETSRPINAAVLSSDGRFLYATGPNVIEIYRVDASGALRQVQHLGPPGNWDPQSIYLVGSTFVAALDILQGVLFYSIDPDSGQLTYVTHSRPPRPLPWHYRE